MCFSNYEVSELAIGRVLERFKKLQELGEVTAWVQLESQPGDFREFPSGLDRRLVQALQQSGISHLYSHQLDAYQKIRQGRNIVVVTPTASGKTLCYNLPVLERLLEHPESRAIYLFPTKALAQDQMAELRRLEDLVGTNFGIHTYDGDTPGDMRRRIRSSARIILSNPDMLHSAILPHHPKWVELFQNLRYVVIDELHTYRGVFGSHVANLIRRLKRIAGFYDSELQFICASATIANPAELAGNLLEEEIVAIEENGAPRAAKDLIFYNPPLTNPQLGLRRSALAAGRRFAEAFLKEKVQTLVFASSRVNVEVLLRYLQNAIPGRPGDPPAVRGYRGGYLPNTRREIERQLREKELLGVVSTNALELGIDIGSLEACILAGYPGSVASTWQQIGRSGRRTGRSAAILIARNLPLDQFMVRSPEYFLDRSPENGLIHPDNLQILVAHIKCAAFELPFQDGESFGKEDLPEVLGFLEEQRMLTRAGSSWHWSDESYPADSVSLRTVSEENFIVFDSSERNRALAEVDFDSAPELIHEDAIYLCEGRQYHVDNLDYDGRKAYVTPVDVDYYTDAITYSGLRILREDESTRSALVRRAHGEVHLVKKFPGYKKFKFYTRENLGYGKILLPLHELHTTAYWFTVQERDLLDIGLRRDQQIRGFLGIAYALHHLATLLLMCDPSDLGRSVGDLSTEWFAQNGPEGLGFYSSSAERESANPDWLACFDPTIFLYDKYPGGIGFSEKLFESHDLALEQVRKMVQACSCGDGCPSCVGPVMKVGEATRRYALEILQSICRRPTLIQ